MENRYFCPDCGHAFKEGEWEYNYNTGKLYFVCPDCDFSGTEVINNSKVENDLDCMLDLYDLEGIEITDEDVNNVFVQMEVYGDTYDEALRSVLEGIRDCLDD
jgi:hypothetical protein